jgi:hypothetical protein
LLAESVWKSASAKGKVAHGRLHRQSEHQALRTAAQERARRGERKVLLELLAIERERLNERQDSAR